MDVDALFKVPIAPNKRVKISDMSDLQFKRSMMDEELEEEENDERMYGSGMSQKDSEIADIVDQAENFKFDDEHAKTTFQKFERIIKKNQEMRSKYPENPIKYADSEADLAEQIHFLQTILSPSLMPLMIKLETHISLLSLLAHENSDISLSCVQVLYFNNIAS
jgi:beta-catenin-like protein 1